MRTYLDGWQYADILLWMVHAQYADILLLDWACAVCGTYCCLMMHAQYAGHTVVERCMRSMRTYCCLMMHAQYADILLLGWEVCGHTDVS